MRTVDGYAKRRDRDAFLERLTEIAERTGAIVQAFDPALVVSSNHLRTAANRAARAFDRGENVARDRGVEMLLYAAGRRQIDHALEMGITREPSAVVVAIDGRRADDPDEAERRAAQTVTEVVDTEQVPEQCDIDRVREYFDITDTELQATAGGVSDMVLERVALLDVNK